MKTQLKLISSAIICGLGAAFSVQAASLVDLSGQGYVTYGDLNSYSLPISALEYSVNTFGNGNHVGPTNPFYVASDAGAIQNLVVIGAGANGQNLNANFTGMDNALSTPSGTGPGNNFFSGVWNTQLDALKNYLGGNELGFFFNNVQNNSGDSVDQNLAAWAQISITDAQHQTIGIWDFTNTNHAFVGATGVGGGVFMGDPSAYFSTGAGPIAGDNSNTDYVLSGGEICLDASFVPVSCSGPHVYGPINHNLGANQAAYVEVAPELNTVLDNLFLLANPQLLSQYQMHVDIRLGCDPNTINPATNCVGRDLNGKSEQIFIAGVTTTGNPIPEPATLALVAFGLLGGCLTAHSRRIA